jgi:amidase
MDYATSVFPVTFVDSNLDDPHPPHEFYNHEDEAIYKLCEPKRSLLVSLVSDEDIIL